jgi:protein-S-isoprenylcysteine O-methyltransferase Ste14
MSIHGAGRRLRRGLGSMVQHPVLFAAMVALVGIQVLWDRRGSRDVCLS